MPPRINSKKTSVYRSIALIIFMMGMGVLFSYQVHAQDGGTPVATPIPTIEATPIPQDCAECHIDVAKNWQTSSHALAFQGETFQTAWNHVNQDPNCLTCHTTGFSAASGEYQHAAVTCEACHGTTPPNHPDDPLMVEPGIEVCTTCHIETYQEWRRSGHGDQQLACTVCHNPHPQTLRFETSSELCLNCHVTDYDVESFAHASHPEEACTNCHWHAGTTDNSEHLLTGVLLPSGHDAKVTTATCNDCHAELVASANVDGSSTESVSIATFSLGEAKIEIEELEAEVSEVRAQGENSAAAHLMQGLIVGGALGILATIILSRLQKWLDWKREDSHE